MKRQVPHHKSGVPVGNRASFLLVVHLSEPVFHASGRHCFSLLTIRCSVRTAAWWEMKAFWLFISCAVQDCLSERHQALQCNCNFFFYIYSKKHVQCSRVWYHTGPFAELQILQTGVDHKNRKHKFLTLFCGGLKLNICIAL